MTFFFYSSFLFAQIEPSGSMNFGRIFGINYDQNTPNKLYGFTTGNHIITSNDNGQNWDIFYAVKNGSFGKLENNLKTYQNNKLTYFLQYGNNAEASRSV